MAALTEHAPDTPPLFPKRDRHFIKRTGQAHPIIEFQLLIARKLLVGHGATLLWLFRLLGGDGENFVNDLGGRHIGGVKLNRIVGAAQRRE